MSENEDADKRDNTSEETMRKTKLKKEKKRKRKATDQTEDQIVSKKSLNESNEIEEDDIADEKKPEEPSKRQIKREKVEKQLMAQRESSKLEATHKALTYVSKWKHAKSDWKFEKLRQIWLMDHLLDENLVPDTIFPTVLEYFEGCKGMARQQLVKKMMEVIKSVEDLVENDNSEENELTNTSKYQRARQILQALPTEN